MRYAGHLSPEEFWERYAELEQRIRATSDALPCYGLVGWSGLRMIGDWQWENDRPVTKGLAHGAPEGTGSRLNVATTVREPGADAALLRLASAPVARNESGVPRRQRELEADPDDSVTLEVDGVGGSLRRLAFQGAGPVVGGWTLRGTRPRAGGAPRLGEGRRAAPCPRPRALPRRAAGAST